MDRILTDRRQRRKSIHGFTLLEVLVALAVLGIALTSIYRLQGQTIMMSASARFYSLAPQLARMRLSEIERRQFNDVAGGTGDFGEEYENYKWAVDIEELPNELITDRQHHLARIDIAVTNNDDNSYHLRTYRYYVD